MIFSFFLQISNHMWADQYTVRMPWSHQDPWSPNNNIDLDVFDRTLDFIAERKFNMIVIDVGDGVKLTSHPEIAAPDAWSIDFLRGKLDELGYDQIPVTSAFSNARSPIQCMGYCKGAISPEHLLGFNAIPWHNTTADEYYSLIHDADRSWQGRRTYFPETL